MSAVAPLRFEIVGTGLWMPEYGSLNAWRNGAPDPGLVRPNAEILPPRLRRRTSFLTRIVSCAVTDANRQAVGNGGGSLSVVRYVIGSAWGELDTTVSLLASMFSDDGGVSPTSFTNSVHNTATGYLSIVSDNHTGSNAVAAGEQTVAMAFLDAVATALVDRQEAMLVLADEVIPAPFAASEGDSLASGERTHAMAVAFQIRSPEGIASVANNERRALVELVQIREDRAPRLKVDDPEALDFVHDGLVPLLRALCCGEEALVPLEPIRGQHEHVWCLRVLGSDSQ